MGVEDGNECAALFALINNIQDVAGIAAEAIKARHDKLVPFAEKLDYRGQFRSTVAARARYLFGTHDYAALGL
jgi:hypothetical protein